MKMRKHRATGRPRGRPPHLPSDLLQQILSSLRRRVDPETGLVQPGWNQLVRELGVSRSTISRRMAILYQLGAIERIVVPISPKISHVSYRLKNTTASQNVTQKTIPIGSLSPFGHSSARK